MDGPYWTGRKSSLDLIDLSSVNKDSLVQVFSCSNTGSISDESRRTCRRNSLERIELLSTVEFLHDNGLNSII